MSIYSGDVNTRILEPVSHSNRRSEFRLIDDEVYLSNIRLINVGADTPAKQGGNGAADHAREKQCQRSAYMCLHSPSL